MVINSLAAQLPGETAWLDAQVLLAHVTGHTRSWLLSHPEAGLNPVQEKTIHSAVQQLQAGTPLPYVLGHWEFFGLDFTVTPDVLIPRPETELLIEYALGYIRSHPNHIYRIIDIGTGSGIISISLAVHVPQASLVATDISQAALKVAQANAERYGVAQSIQFIQADLLPIEPADNGFDLICANLPYIPSDTLKSLEIYGKEPTLALDGGMDGLDLIRRLISLLSLEKISHRLILLEIEQRQGLAVSMLARASFPDARIEIKKDLAGHDRLVIINT
jgi:release factor glutamine methyltransferase